VSIAPAGVSTALMLGFYYIDLLWICRNTNLLYMSARCTTNQKQVAASGIWG